MARRQADKRTRPSPLIAPLTPDSWDPDAAEDATSPVVRAALEDGRRSERISAAQLDAEHPLSPEARAWAEAELDRLEAEAEREEERRRRPTGRRSNPEAELSGRLVVRFPKSVHRELAQRAELEGVSLNQLILAYVSRGLGQDATAPL
jgi:predicted HicB family RNase H-like nuclease